MGPGRECGMGSFIQWQDGRARHISKIANMNGSGEVMVGEGTLATWLLRVGRRVSVCQWSSMELRVEFYLHGFQRE